VQSIAKELIELGSQSKDDLTKLLHSVLTKSNVEPDVVANVVDAVSNDPSLHLNQKHLSTEYLRKQYYKKHLFYTEPQEKVLLDSDGKATSNIFHYVPILVTIKNMFKDPNVRYQFENRPQISKPGVFSDFVDGSVFQESDFLQRNPDGLPIILYEDGLEICRVLGSARGKHKVVAVYMVLGFCSPEWRSHVDNIQLVGLCKNKILDREQFYKPLVEDLKKLEDDGLEIYEGKCVKGTAAFIAGDNLGLQGLMGMQESFGKTKYICRKCVIPRELFKSEFPFFANRTKEHFDEALLKIKNENLESYKGIKGSCSFHELKYYHVCKGTPFCLAHDLLEGVVCIDLALFIAHLVFTSKWFDVNYLNARIMSFPYSAEDRRDKPVPLLESVSKIVGSACQVWTFIKLLPLLIADKIKDPNHEVWDLVLRLREVVLLVTAPAFKKTTRLS